MKINKCIYERYLTDKGFPEGEINKLHLRKNTSYGRWLRINRKEEFEKGYVEWKKIQEMIHD